MGFFDQLDFFGGSAFFNPQDPLEIYTLPVTGFTPSIVIDHEALRYLTPSTGTFDELLTYTSTDPRTYTDGNGELQTLAAGNARVNDHIYNGTSFVRAGMLDEDATVQILGKVSDFDEAPWAGTRVDLTGTADGPGGAGTATIMNDDNSGGTSTVFIEQSVTVATSTTHTLSALMKKGSLDFGVLRTLNFTAPSNSTTWFDLATGVVGTVAAAHTATMTDEGNGYYRCSITFVTDAADTSGELRIAMASSDGSQTFPIDGTANIIIWGSDFVADAVPSSHIPNPGTGTVARASDTTLIPAAGMAKAMADKAGSAELVVNGDFGTGDLTGYGGNHSNGSSNITVIDGAAVFNSVGDFIDLTQSVLTVGKKFILEFDFVFTSGSGLRVDAGTVTQDTFTTSGRKSLVLSNHVSSALGFIRAGATVCSIDNITVREVTMPAAISIAVDGFMTYADEDLNPQVRGVQWGTSGDFIWQQVRTDGSRTGASSFVQRAASDATNISVIGGLSDYSPDVNVLFSLASRHLPDELNGAHEGTLLTADLTPTALPDLVTADFEIATVGNFIIKSVRIWFDDVGDLGIHEATGGTLGAELFSGSPTLGDGWSDDGGGVYSCDGTQASASDLVEGATVIGNTYLASFDVTSYTTGNIRTKVGGVNGTNRTAIGSYTELVVATGTTGVGVNASSSFVGTVDNITVKELEPAP